jgi:peptide/nickel transport system permease protein
LSQARQIWYKFRKNRLSIGGIAILLVFVFLAIAGPLIVPYDPYKLDLRNRLITPTNEHILGTDELGRDILSRIIVGTRFTLWISFLAVTIAIICGVPIGAIAGYYGGLVGNIIMRVVDILLSFPAILLAIVIVTILGPGLNNAAIALAIAGIPIYSRLMNGMVLTVKELQYVEAARMSGAGNTRILFRHIMPNCISPIIIQYSLELATMIIIAAALGFLGLGAQPPLPEWGAMISSGSLYIRSAPHVALFPGLAIVAAVLAFNMFGDGLRDALDPRMH